MKKRLLTIAVLMSGVFASHAQIGIGTLDPNASSMLDVSSSNSGILIPRIALTSDTDTTTITSGNVNSLLVYNISTTDDLKPGYYYWYETKWQRLVTGSEMQAALDNFEIPEETITHLTILESGVYQYENEEGDLAYINVPLDVINNFVNITQNPDVFNHLVTIIQNHSGNVYYDGTTFMYMDENHVMQNINFEQLVQQNQTLTSLTYNSVTNELSYTDEAGVTHNIALQNTKNAGMQLQNNVLVLTDTDGDAVSVDLSSFLDNTDNQQITDFVLIDNVLTITLENGGTQTVDLTPLVNGTHLVQGENVTVTGSGTTTDPYVIAAHNTTNESMEIINNQLILTDSDGETVTVDLSSYLDNTDEQQIETFEIVGNVLTLTLENGGTKTVDLSYLQNSTHVEAGTNVTITGDGNEATPYVISSHNTKNEGMSITDNMLTLSDSDGDTVQIDLSAYLDNTDEQEITEFILNENNELLISIENGNTQVVNLNPLVTHVEEGANVTITGNGTAANPYVITPHKTIVTGGVNVVVAPQEDGITTNYTISVPTANGNQLGVVKQADTAPTVLISSEGELSINFDALSDFKEVTQDYAATLQDFVLFGNAVGNTINITLPSPVGVKGKKLTIKKSDTNEEAYVNVTTTAGSIEGIAELYTSLPYSGWDIMSDGNNWRIVNKF